MNNMHMDNQLVAPELASVDVDGLTRQSFLLRGALAAGAVYGLGSVTPFVTQAMAQDNMKPVDVLNFALTLEYLEAAFYERGLKQVDLPSDAKSIAQEAGEHEAEHVEALTKTIKSLGGKPAAKPNFDFGDAFSGPDAFLELAQTLEDTGVRAYNGAGPALIQEDDLLKAAGSIVQVEARHAAAIRQLREQPITDGAFDRGLAKQKVLDAVQPFIKS